MAQNYFDQFDAQQPSANFFDQFDPGARPAQEQGDFMRGAKVAIGQTAPIAKGLVGLVGATGEKSFGEGGIWTGVKDWGLEGYQQGMQKLAPLQRDTDELTTAWQRAKDGDLGALVDWAQYGLGYALGQAGEAVAVSVLGAAAGSAMAPGAGTAAGAAGGLVAKGAVKEYISGLVRKSVMAEAEKIVAANAGKIAAEQAVGMATKAVAGRIGQTAALLAWGGTQELGSIYPEAEAEALAKGEKLSGADLARVWGTGLAAGAVEGLTDRLGIDAAMGKLNKLLPGGRVASAATAGLGGAVVEGTTEAAQTALGRYGAGKELTGAEAEREYINAAGLGALGGAAVGGAAGAIQGRNAAEKLAQADDIETAAQAAEELAFGGGPDIAALAGLKRQVEAPALPAPVQKQEWEVVDGVRALPAPEVTAPAAAPVLPALPAPTAQTLIADTAGNVIPQPSAHRAEAMERQAAIDAEAAARAEIGLTPDVERAQVARLEPAQEARVFATQSAAAIEARRTGGTVEPADGGGFRVARTATAMPDSQPEVLPTDKLTADGMPYGSRSAAVARARKEGGEVVQVQGGWVVRTENPDAGTGRGRDGRPELAEPAGAGLVDAGAVPGDVGLVPSQQPTESPTGLAGTVGDGFAARGAAVAAGGGNDPALTVQPAAALGPAESLSIDAPQPGAQNDSPAPTDADYEPARPEQQQLAAKLAERLSRGAGRAIVFDAVAPRSGAVGGRGRESAAVSTVARRFFGHEVVFVRFRDKPLFNGAMSKAMPGVVFVNADANKPMMAVLGHELVHGMEQSAPDVYAEFENRMVRLLKSGASERYLEKLREKYGRQGLKAPANYQEELHADIVGDFFTDKQFWADMAQDQPRLFQKVAQAVVRFLDDMAQKIADVRPFGTEQYLEDIAAARAAVVSAMRQFSGAQVGAMTTQSEGINLSVDERGSAPTRAQDQTETPEFKRWFGDSKVVDENGKPLVVYHGTTADFNAFDPEKSKTTGIFFSATPHYANIVAELDGARGGAARVIPAFVSVKNPMYVKASEFSRADTRRAKAEGFDGLITLDEEGRPSQITAFRSEQIKSAIGNRGTFDPANADIRAKRGAGRGMDFARAKRFAKQFDKLGLNRVNVARTIEDLPQDKREALLAKGADGIRGAYFPDTDDVWVFSDNVRDENEFTFVALHEAFHRGLRNVIGKDADVVLRQIYATNSKVRKLADEQMERFGIPKEEAIEEALADLAGRGDISELRMFPRLIQLVKSWLQQAADTLGITMRWTDDMVREFVVGTYRAGMRKEPTAFAGEAPMASRGKVDQTETEAFKRWFGDSKVVDAEGKPLVVYHGTTRGVFSEFKLNGYSRQPAFVFAGSRRMALTYSGQDNDVDGGPKSTKHGVFPVYLSMQNPKIVEWGGDYFAREDGSRTEEVIRQAKEEGYDGVIIRSVNDPGGYASMMQNRGLVPEGHDIVGDVYAVFEPTQIKSAIGNRGSFDPTSPDIRLSRAATLPDWAQSGALKSAAEKIDTYRPAEPIKDKIKAMSAGWKERLIQGMVDAYAPLKKLSMEAYVAARMTKAADGAFEGMLMYGKPKMDADGALLGELDGKGFLGTMQELDGEHDRFFMWLAGNRAARLAGEGRENLFTAAEIEAMKRLNEGEMKGGRSRSLAYAAALKEFNAYSKSVLDIAEQTGLIDGESRKLWEHDFYVPFYRVAPDDSIAGPTRIKGLVRQQAFKKLKGGTEPLGDLMENTLRNWSHLLSAALANQAAGKALTAAENAGVAIEAKEDTAKEMAKSIGKKGGAVYFMDQGRERWFVVEDPAVLAAISSMESVGLNGLPMKIMGKFKHYLTLGVTIAPAFKLRNLFRDSIAAPATNEMSFNVLKNVAEGWKGTAKTSEQYQQMLFGGALMRFGTYLEGDRAEHVKRLIKDGVKDETILNTPEKVKAALGKLWDAWQGFGDRLENVNRASLYEQLRAQGKSHLEASFLARDMMDFGLQGAWAGMRILTQVVPFLNARVQGLYKLGRGAKENPRRFGYVVGAVALTSIALMLAYEDDEDWKAREDWDRDGFWWFKIGNTAYRIPKPFEVGALGTIAERTVELLANDEMTGRRFAERMKQMLLDTFSMNPVPQAFKPMIDLYANKDSFTGRAIESPGMENHSKAERYGPATTVVAKVLGQAGDYTNLSPVQIDHLIRGYFGWLGAFAAQTVDVAAQPFGEVSRPTRKLDEFMGGFVKELPSAQSRYATEFYEQAKAVSQVMADIKRARDIGDFAKAQELLDENKDKVALARLYSQAERQMTLISTNIRRIQGNPSMSADEKRAQIDRLTAMRNQLAKQVRERQVQAQGR